MTERGREAARAKDEAAREPGTDAPKEPRVSFEPGARAYIRARGGHLTVRASRRHGCCGGTAFLPMAEAGKPEADGDQFVPWDDGEITIWLSRRFMESSEGQVSEGGTAGDRAPFPIRIGLDRLLGLSRLRVEGPGITT